MTGQPDETSMHVEYRGDGNPVANTVLVGLDSSQTTSQQTQSMTGSQSHSNNASGNVANAENENDLMSVLKKRYPQ